MFTCGLKLFIDSIDIRLELLKIIHAKLDFSRRSATLNIIFELIQPGVDLAQWLVERGVIFAHKGLDPSRRYEHLSLANLQLLIESRTIFFSALRFGLRKVNGVRRQFVKNLLLQLLQQVLLLFKGKTPILHYNHSETGLNLLCQLVLILDQ